MRTVNVVGLSTGQYRRYEAVAKRVGRADKAARLALRIGLLILAEGDVTELERQAAEREAAADTPAADAAPAAADTPAADAAPASPA